MPTEPWFDLPLISVGGWLGAILVGLFMMMTGRLVPKKIHDSMIADRDSQIVNWRETAKTERELASQAVANQDKLLNSINTTNELIRSLPGISERNVS